MFTLIESVSTAWHDLANSDAIRAAIANDTGLTWPGSHGSSSEKRAYMLAIYDNRSNCGTSRCAAFREMEEHLAGVRESWEIHGSNSDADPTYGGRFFSHQSGKLDHATISDRYSSIRSNFYALAIESDTFNYALSYPYRVGEEWMMTVTGTELCVTFGSCAAQ